MTRTVEITTLITEITDARFVCSDYDESFNKAIMDYAKHVGMVSNTGILLVNIPVWHEHGKPCVVVRAYPATKKAGRWHHSVKQFLNILSTVTVAITLQRNQNHESVILVWFKNIRPHVQSLEHSKQFAEDVLHNRTKQLTTTPDIQKYVGSSQMDTSMVESIDNLF